MEEIIHGDTSKPTIIGGQQIDLIVCINLVTRKDRELHMIKVMAEQGLPFRFYKAVLNPVPVQGCKESHLAVIKYAREHNCRNVLIFEDDIEFCKPISEVPTFPKEWDMLYIGGLMRDLHNMNDIHNKDWISGLVICCQSYIVNSTVFDKILTMDVNRIKEVDLLFANTIHRDKRTYMSAEFFTKQIGGWSDLEKRFKWIDYKWPKTGYQYLHP